MGALEELEETVLRDELEVFVRLLAKYVPLAEAELDSSRRFLTLGRFMPWVESEAVKVGMPIGAEVPVPEVVEAEDVEVEPDLGEVPKEEQVEL
jgi:hypothetical protein